MIKYKEIGIEDLGLKAQLSTRTIQVRIFILNLSFLVIYSNIPKYIPTNIFREFYKCTEGTYYPLCSLSEETKQKWIDSHFLFEQSDKYLQAAGSMRDWPASRGIYFNSDKTFLVWLNEEAERGGV